MNEYFKTYLKAYTDHYNRRLETDRKITEREAEQHYLVRLVRNYYEDNKLLHGIL